MPLGVLVPSELMMTSVAAVVELATSNPFLIADFKRRRVFGLHFAPIINSGRRNIGMPQPFLDFGDVRFMVEGIGGGGVAGFLVGDRRGLAFVAVDLGALDTFDRVRRYGV